ncbi:MAG: hypothetical protein COB36_07145 [Alphaproteobacteria bacterium]|nr:MAG: hypothetical protein COB36_07145 [Alphaproteobacteria bacterium]
MSSKYNRFLLSACLPVMAMAVCLPTPVFAGFEWTPPEETAPAPLPLETLEPTPPQPVLSEPLPAMEIPEDTTEPAIQIKVLDDDMEMDKKVDEAIENAIDMGELETDKPVEETITIELEDEIEVITTEITADENVPAMVEPTTDVEIDVEVKEEIKEDVSQTPPQSTSLSINLYPLADDAEKTSETQTPIVLPADSNKDLDDLTAEDVNITATKTQTAPQEKIFWNETETFDVIEGFGNDMPLALALRQIVPAQYAFSFGKDVNPGASISWTGGQPWNSVLNTALAPLNITFTLNDKKLLLRSAGTMPVAKPVTENTPPPEKIGMSIEDTIDDVIAAEQEDVVLDMPKTEDSSASEIIVIEAGDTNHAQSAEISTPAHNIKNDSLQDAINITATEEKAAPAEKDTAKAEPVDIIETAKEAETIEDIIEPLEPILKVDNTDDNISIKRNSIQDPGEVEAAQPVLVKPSKASMLLDEKKNEKIALSAKTSPTKASSTVDYTKEALKQIAAQKIVILDTPAENAPEQVEAQDAPTEQIIVEEITEATQAPAEITIQEVAVLDTPVITEIPVEDSAELDKVMPAEITAKDIKTPSSSFRIQPSDTIKIWEAGRKSNLQKILRQWSEKENIELVWNASENYVLDKDVFISGTFKNAIDILFSKGVKNPPKHILAQTPSYNLRVEDNQ